MEVLIQTNMKSAVSYDVEFVRDIVCLCASTQFIHTNLHVHTEMDGQADSWVCGCGCTLSHALSFSFGLLIWRKGERGWLWVIYALEGIKMTIKSPTEENIRLGKEFILGSFHP